MSKNQLKKTISDHFVPEPEILGWAVCPTPTDFLSYRLSLGNPTFAFCKENDKIKDKWFFSNSLQDAVAFALDWHKLCCKVEQFSQLQDDGTQAYAYRVTNLNNREVDLVLYSSWIWESATGDPQNINRAATPEVMTILRQELFKFMCERAIPGLDFTMLDFSRPDGEDEFLRDWAYELA